MFSTRNIITHHWEVLKFTSRFLANASFLIDHIHDVYIEHLVTKFEFDNEDSPEFETLEDLLKELMGNCSGPHFLQVNEVPLRVQSKVYLFGEQVNAGGYFRQTESTDLEDKVMSGPSTCVVEVATTELTVQEICQALWDQSQIVSDLFIKKCKDELTSTEEYHFNCPTSDCVLHEDTENPVPDVALNVVMGENDMFTKVLKGELRSLFLAESCLLSPATQKSLGMHLARLDKVKVLFLPCKPFLANEVLRNLGGKEKTDTP